MGIDPTLGEVAGHSGPVGIECGRCLRRVLFDAKAILKPRKDDRRRLSQVRLRCSRCGSREFSAQLFPYRAKATTFMKGYR
jgi:hypothetical protein